MRYWAVLFLLLFSFGIFSGCGKAPMEDVNYNEMRDQPPPERQEGDEGTTKMGQ